MATEDDKYDLDTKARERLRADELKAQKELNSEIQDYVEKLDDATDISEKLYNIHRNTKLEIRDIKVRLRDIGSEMQRNVEIIKTNTQEIENLGKAIQEDQLAIQALNSADEDLLQQKSAAQQRINRLQREQTDIMKQQAGISDDLTKKSQERAELEEAAIKNSNIKADITQRLADIQKNIAYAEENGLTTGEAYEQLLKSRAAFEKQLNDSITEGLAIGQKWKSNEIDTGKLMQRRAELQERYESKNIKIAAKKGEILALDEAINENSKMRAGLEGAILEKQAKQEKLKKDNKDLETINELRNQQKKILESDKLRLLTQLNFVKLVQLGLERFMQLDKAAEDFRRSTGFSVNQMKTLRKDAEAINVQFSDMGVSIEKVYDSAKALVDVFGRTSLVSKETLKTVSLLSANLNVAEADTANVLSMFQGLGGATEEAATNVLKVGAGISEKAGVPFSMVMKDIANASEQTTTLIGANPTKLMKAAIAARSMGMELNKLVSSQRKLLDFSSSINDELEASAMLGKNISFQKARQLAYEGDIEGSAKAILETVKASGDFDQMSVYQRERLAAASGMELKDLTKMLAVEKQRDAILYGADQEKAMKLLAQEEELKKLKEINDLNSQDLVAQQDKAIMQEKMQGVMTRLKNITDSLMIALADVLEPVITALSDFVVPAFKVLVTLLKVTIIPLFKFMAYPLQVIGEYVSDIGKKLEKWLGTDDATSKFKSISDWLDTTAGKVTKFIIGGGLLYMMFFGKMGLSGLLSMLATPFTFVGRKALEQLAKVPGAGTLTKIFKPKSVASTVTDVASKTAGKAADVVGSVSKGASAVTSGLGVRIFLQNLAAGLKAMGNARVLAGVGVLALSAVPLLLVTPIALMSALLGPAGPLIYTGFKFLAKGIGAMASPKVLLGALGIAAVGIAIMPFAISMKMFSEVDWGKVGIGALALVGFTAAAFGLGLLLASGAGAVIFTAGVIGIAALGAALIPFGIAAIAAGYGIKMFGEGISGSIESIRKLAELNLLTTAAGIAAIGVALAAFGGGSAAAGLGSFVGKLLGGDPIKKMQDLAAIGTQLAVTADAISKISEATAKFSAVQSFSEAITKLAESFNTLNRSINGFNFEGLKTITKTTMPTPATSTETSTIDPVTGKETRKNRINATTGTLAGVESKLDTLISLLKDGQIVATVDVNKLSTKVAKSAGT